MTQACSLHLCVLHTDVGLTVRHLSPPLSPSHPPTHSS
jgi:hypothetical protein